MKTIWKFGPFRPGEVLVVNLPEGARIRHVGTQSSLLHMWAEVDPEAKTAIAKFIVLGTGWPFDDYATDIEYVGTTQVGALVWHLYAIAAKAAR